MQTYIHTYSKKWKLLVIVSRHTRLFLPNKIQFNTVQRVPKAYYGLQIPPVSTLGFLSWYLWKVIIKLVQLALEILKYRKLQSSPFMILTLYYKENATDQQKKLPQNFLYYTKTD